MPDPLEVLDERTVDPDPFAQFRRWYDAAVLATGDRAAAMTVATATPDGRPSARVVLLRGIDERGFTFYTNRESRKGHELAANPAVAAMLYWSDLDAQVRIEGRVVLVEDDESDAYFAHRPRGHQIGAWASDQSRPVRDRATLEARVRDAEARFPDDVPRPSYWGGYRIEPETFEFWRNRTDRVHDRVRYSRADDGSWTVQRLSP
ncbi:MAG: pyridoxamine 5'-phosphate oxidase [Acidimicrobiia bacterium]